MKRSGRIINLKSFKQSRGQIAEYLNMNRVKYFRNQEVEFNQSLFESINGRRFGISVFGGEPHLVLLNSEAEYQELISKFGLDKRMNSKTIIKNLKYLASVFGNYFTFNKRLFPHGVNFDIGLIKDGEIYVATHEINLTTSHALCRYQQIMTGFCECLTHSSTAGGAVMVYFAKNMENIRTKKVKTIQPGGEILFTWPVSTSRLPISSLAKIQANIL